MKTTTNSIKTDAYQIVTDRIIAQLQNGIIPWRKPWIAVRCNDFTKCAVSGNTGRPYSLINQIVLGKPGRYYTFNQASKLGAAVRKGAKAQYVVFWKQVEVDDETDPDPDAKTTVPMLRYYKVFHESDIDGLPAAKPFEGFNNESDRDADELISAYSKKSGCRIEFLKQDRAYYSPAQDVIRAPVLAQYKNPAEFYSTTYHEMTHSTGHSSRLDRLNKLAAFGSEDYSKEELTAEIGSAMLMNITGLENQGTMDNSAAYVAGWLNALQNDKRLVVGAASRAEKAVDFILDTADAIVDEPEEEITTEPETTETTTEQPDIEALESMLAGAAAKIDELTAENEALKARIAELEAAQTAGESNSPAGAQETAETETTNQPEAKTFTKREFKNAVLRLEAFYRHDIVLSVKPKTTVTKFYNADGQLAVETIANLITAYAWDGRISKRNVEWAASVLTEYTELSTEIHRAHLDQLADAMRELTSPKNPDPDDGEPKPAPAAEPEKPEPVPAPPAAPEFDEAPKQKKHRAPTQRDRIAAMKRLASETNFRSMDYSGASLDIEENITLGLKIMNPYCLAWLPGVSEIPETVPQSLEPFAPFDDMLKPALDCYEGNAPEGYIAQHVYNTAERIAELKAYGKETPSFLYKLYDNTFCDAMKLRDLLTILFDKANDGEVTIWNHVDDYRKMIYLTTESGAFAVLCPCKPRNTKAA